MNINKTELMKKILLSLLFILTIYSLNTAAQENIYGIYSNIDTTEGEPSGFEMFFLNDGRPGKCSTTVIFQAAEGWPEYPEMLDCCGFSANHVEFISKKWGKFVGKIENGTLSGEFINMKYKIVLKRGLSIWQQ